jgi:hypothetical protein
MNASRLFLLCVNSGFHRAVDGICVLLENYAANSGNSLPTFRNNLMVSFLRVKNPRRKQEERLLTLEGGIDRLSRNVGKQISLYAVISQKSTDLTSVMTEALIFCPTRDTHSVFQWFRKPSQGCTNLPNIYEPSPISRRQKDGVNKFHVEDSQISGDTVQNLVVRDLCTPALQRSKPKRQHNYDYPTLPYYLLTKNIIKTNLVVSSPASSSGDPGIFLDILYPEDAPVFLSPSWKMPN